MVVAWGSRRPETRIKGYWMSDVCSSDPDSTPRTLHVYVGGRAAQGQFTASLSDGSAPAYTDGSPDNPTGATVQEYTRSYQANPARQTLSTPYTPRTHPALGIVHPTPATPPRPL